MGVERGKSTRRWTEGGPISADRGPLTLRVAGPLAYPASLTRMPPIAGDRNDSPPQQPANNRFFDRSGRHNIGLRRAHRVPPRLRAARLWWRIRRPHQSRGCRGLAAWARSRRSTILPFAPPLAARGGIRPHSSARRRRSKSARLAPIASGWSRLDQLSRRRTGCQLRVQGRESSAR